MEPGNAVATRAGRYMAAVKIVQADGEGRNMALCLEKPNKAKKSIRVFVDSKGLICLKAKKINLAYPWDIMRNGGTGCDYQEWEGGSGVAGADE